MGHGGPSHQHEELREGTPPWQQTRDPPQACPLLLRAMGGSVNAVLQLVLSALCPWVPGAAHSAQTGTCFMSCTAVALQKCCNVLLKRLLCRQQGMNRNGN